MLLLFITKVNRPSNYNTNEAEPLMHIEDYSFTPIIKFIE